MTIDDFRRKALRRLTDTDVNAEVLSTATTSNWNPKAPSQAQDR